MFYVHHVFQPKFPSIAFKSKRKNIEPILRVHVNHVRDKCHKLIQERFYWPGGYTYIAKETARCVACSYKKAKQ